MILCLPEYHATGSLALHLEHEIPHHLLPLEQAGWPAEPVSRIVKAYQSVGLKNPLKQKLVEPNAIVFGGKYNEGVTDLSSVNWDMVGDYFEWEAQSVNGTAKESERLQEQADKKWGGYFSHYPVYEDYH